MKDLIKRLVESTGPSGYENAVRDIVKEEIKELVDEMYVDALGNLIARKGTKSPDGMRIMLAAHLDEIGLIVTHVSEKGFVRFTTLGGVRPHTLLGGRVRFVKGPAGLIGGEKVDSPSNVHSMDQLFIDVGADSRETCPVGIGDVAVFDRPMLDLGNRLVAKSMDDRIGVVVLVETLRQLQNSPHEVFFVFTVQEEVGTRGATTAAYALDPDLGIAVDVTLTGDTPKFVKMEVGLGKGPAIKVRDSGMLADPRLVRVMTETAEKAGIPYQLEILDGGSTDARVIQLTRAGVPSGCVSIPCRYVHTPSEMVEMSDVENGVRLLVKMLGEPISL